MAAVASSRWMLHTGGGRGDPPPHNVERFECLEKAEKRYINVMNYYYYYLLTINYDFSLNKLLICCLLIVSKVVVKFRYWIGLGM